MKNYEPTTYTVTAADQEKEVVTGELSVLITGQAGKQFVLQIGMLFCLTPDILYTIEINTKRQEYLQCAIIGLYYFVPWSSW